MNVIPIWNSRFRLGKNGDCYDRYLMRMEEMRQANRIMQQCIAENAVGPVMTADGKVVPPRRAEMKRSMEALIHHFKLYTEGYHCRLARFMRPWKPRKANSVFIWSRTARNKPYRCKFRAAQLSASAGDGLHVPRSHGGRCLRRAWLAGYRVRRNRPMTRNQH